MKRSKSWTRGGEDSKRNRRGTNFQKIKKFPRSDPLVRPWPVSSSAWIDQKEGAIQSAAKRDQRGDQRAHPLGLQTGQWACSVAGVAGQGSRDARLHIRRVLQAVSVTSFVSEASTRHFLSSHHRPAIHLDTQTQSAQQRGGRVLTTNSKHKRTTGFRCARLVQLIKEKAVVNKHSSLRVVGAAVQAMDVCVCSAPPATTYQQAVSVTAICSPLSEKTTKKGSIPDSRRQVRVQCQTCRNSLDASNKDKTIRWQGRQDAKRGEGCFSAYRDEEPTFQGTKSISNCAM